MLDHVTANSSNLFEITKNYPKWVINTIGNFRKDNCDRTIAELDFINQTLVKQKFRKIGFVNKNLISILFVEIVIDQRING